MTLDSPPSAIDYELDVEHGVGYRLFIKGQLIDEGDRLILVRKDKQIDGRQPSNDTLELVNDTANCDQANNGLAPTGALNVQQDVRDHGGVLNRSCSTFANGCDPATCTFKNESASDYHEDCRMVTAFNLVGTHDTIHSDRHPWDPFHTETNAPPNAPPWFDSLDDDHTVASPNSVAGQNQTVESYEETGTYYVSAFAQAQCRSHPITYTERAPLCRYASAKTASPPTQATRPSPFSATS